MMKIMLTLLLFCGSAFSLDTLTTPYVFSDSGVIVAKEFNDNNDSLRIGVNSLIDSLENKFVRFADFDDSTIVFKKPVKIGELGVYLDSITVNGSNDTMFFYLINDPTPFKAPR